MSEGPAPKRRWFQWSLRTMFVVVTLFGCWLGYQLNWIRQRHTFYARHSGRTVTVGLFNPSGPAPGVLWLFGEIGWPSLCLKVESNDMDSLTEADRRLLLRAQQLFPEAAKNEIWLTGKDRLGYDWATTDQQLSTH